MKNIVIGQKVQAAKVARAKELRKNMTPEEALLWQQLRRNQLGGYHFRRQQVIDGFIVDFYCHAVGLVVEVDGEIHEQHLEYDRERDQVLASRGLCVLRVTNAQVREQLREVLQQILEKCRERTNPPAPFPIREGGAKLLSPRRRD